MNEDAIVKEKLDISDVWKAVLSELEILVSKTNYLTWVAPTRAEYVGEDIIRVVCLNAIAKTRYETKLVAAIESTIEKVTHKKYHLEFVVGKVKEEGNNDGTTQNLGPLFINNASDTPVIKAPITNGALAKTGLNPKYTFESYITGKNNQLAYAIASAIADKPGEAYNPVFLYSGVGLGKTHLIQAIGRRILDRNPQMNVLYCTGESFTNELIESIQSGKGSARQNQFRNKYRSLDVMLIDDIQFIAGKEGTQEEFFHTFNALYQSGRQVVITSDRPPKDLKNIAERITSRFSSGVIADIQEADVETRSAILRRKRDINKDPLSNEVIDFVASKINTNIRELEGAYIQVLTHCRAYALEMTVENAAKALGQSIKEESQNKQVNINQILKAVCTYYSVKSTDIKGKVRTKDLVVPRQMVMYLIKDMTNTPLMTIGDFLGGRDHTTVMHGIRKVEEDAQIMQKMKQDIANIKQILYA